MHDLHDLHDLHGPRASSGGKGGSNVGALPQSDVAGGGLPDEPFRATRDSPSSRAVGEPPGEHPELRMIRTLKRYAGLGVRTWCLSPWFSHWVRLLIDCFFLACPLAHGPFFAKTHTKDLAKVTQCEILFYLLEKDAYNAKRVLRLFFCFLHALMEANLPIGPIPEMPVKFTH